MRAMSKTRGPKPLPKSKLRSKRLNVFFTPSEYRDVFRYADAEGYSSAAEWVRRTMDKRIKQLKRKH